MVAGNSILVDMMAEVFIDCKFSRGGITITQSRVLAGPVFRKIGSLGGARIDAKVSVDILPFPILPSKRTALVGHWLGYDLSCLLINDINC